MALHGSCKQSSSGLYLQTPQLNAVMAASDEAHTLTRHEAHAVALTASSMSCRQLRLCWGIVHVRHICTASSIAWQAHTAPSQLSTRDTRRRLK